MSETYKFYVQMDGETYGPYSAHEVRDLDLLGDVLVTEESMNGQWLPASKFDFDDMVRKESGIPSAPRMPQSSANVSNYQRPYVPQQSYQPTSQIQSDDTSSPIGWCILSFLIPLVGWILYFCWRGSKPRKASAVCTWAWIGFAVNIIFSIAGAF
jgi:hypothetical protein